MMVALSILVLVIAASTSGLDSALKVSRFTRLESAAADALESVTENLRSSALDPKGFNAIPITTESLPSVTVGGQTFSITQTAEWVNSGTTSSVCSGAASLATTGLVLRVTESASWPGAAAPVSTSTTLSPPLGTFSSVNGSLAVTVQNALGGPASNVVVTAAQGSTSQSITTGADGCAFFASLPPSASYVVTLSEGTSGVDPLENSPSSHSGVTVTANKAVSVVYSFDQGGTITYTEAVSPSPASGMGVSLASTNFTSGIDPFPTATGTLTPIYPVTYGIFAGVCTDANPLGTNTGGTAFYPGASTTNVTVTAAAPTVVALPLYTLQLKALTLGLIPIANATVTAIAGAAGTTYGGVCPSGAPTYTLSSTGSTGISTTAVPLGHLAVTISGTVAGLPVTGKAYLWVTPSGVSTYNANGSIGTQQYATGSPTPISVTLQ